MRKNPSQVYDDEKNANPLFDTVYCRMLNLSSSGGYYAWLVRKPSKRAKEEGQYQKNVSMFAPYKSLKNKVGSFSGNLAAHGSWERA